MSKRKDNSPPQPGAAYLPKTAHAIISADDLLRRWPGLDAWALAMLINKEINERSQLRKYDAFPPVYRLLTAQPDSNQVDTIYYLQFIYEENPFQHNWAGDEINFDFREIVFEERDVINYEHLHNYNITTGGFMESDYYKEMLYKVFPGAKQGQSPAGAKNPNYRNPSRATAAHQELADIRWRDMVPSFVTAAGFVTSQYIKEGKGSITQKAYNEELARLGLPTLGNQHNEVFRAAIKEIEPKMLNLGAGSEKN